MMMAGAYAPPISLFSVLPEKRECAVHGGREKRGALGACGNLTRRLVIRGLTPRGRKASGISSRASRMAWHIQGDISRLLLIRWGGHDRLNRLW